ncbi:MAG: succinate dehydrogenase/fumarate reductase iron-sulfur subunit [Flavobacteriaceae bacterium]|jgi:succinate dehydrogenase / fumarate reductase iron-sulfur subunit|nr:succinate dehydrogenase/fumarate reductase iron-sulfur subunit [Flavobacteriaceae bacterium]MBT4246352.1 succinate dehydrogenase/fumarate reductase iron-sulfur subunit [Flavobacteriaceae bacterium]MBT4415975.1 succinate dehydrogenase/fumarate reductase iron-sulfur subunit [Flavobacteriaceae bacterium]MBT5596418.1 succinate dehydrogenase/fumarate reductase iron-sulfur subunit [Flavobacteriaceae bacterium]MBT6689674.1 succinate dehydrogenase/fumarate reductase iron-sulfur subunit [Flavobacteri
MSKRDFKIYRGDDERGELVSYKCEITEGMVVLDAIHRIQADQANDLACRWNCKAGKCGSCSVEINGRPKLACMTRMNEFEEDQTVVITPLKSFPVIKDIVSDVSWNYEQNKKITPFSPSKKDKEKDFVMMQKDVDRVQHFRKCIECYLCQNVCHVIRDNDAKEKFVGPRFMARLASLEMHPYDRADRIPDIKNDHGSGMCNITKCCTEVCPEGIQITDDAIIPLKERVVDRFYDPITILSRKIFGKEKRS